MTIVRAGLAAVSPGRLVVRAASADPVVSAFLRSPEIDLVAAGKAAPAMARAFAGAYPGRIRRGLVVGTHLDGDLPAGLDWIRAGHPVPDDASETAGRRALAVARAGEAGDPLVVLISGGGSALLAVPADGLTLETKQAVSRRLLAAGADIHALNTVRKHLSRVKGGQLAASRRGPTLALAISDVVGDDPSVIASGPTVPDRTTFAEALGVLDRFGGRAAYPAAALALLESGARGERPETPKPGDPALARSLLRVIGSARDVLDGARAAALALGCEVERIDDPVVGEAREAARGLLPRLLGMGQRGRRTVVLSAGETTVHVDGDGKGGRNQELALAAVPLLAGVGVPVALASIGTDGVDGPTDAAGAVADDRTAERARAAGLDPLDFLRRHDSYRFFDALGDLVLTGPTGTNVGDVQVLLIDRAAAEPDATERMPTQP